MATEKIVTVIWFVVLIMLVYALGVNVGKYKAFKALEPREMFPVMEKIADEIGKDEVGKRNMALAMLRLMREILDRF